MSKKERGFPLSPYYPKIIRVQLVPKLYLGTEMAAKLSLAGKNVPKHSLGTRGELDDRFT
jgi:hypothetical protein